MIESMINTEELHEARRILLTKEQGDKAIFAAYRQLIAEILEEWAVNSTLVFTTEYARNAFVAYRYGFTPALRFALHRVRMADAAMVNDEITWDNWRALLDYVFTHLVHLAEGTATEGLPGLPEPFFTDWKSQQQGGQFQCRRLILLGLSERDGNMMAEDVETGMTLEVAVPEGSDLTGYSHAIAEIARLGIFPIEVNALGVQIDGNVLKAIQWVVDPDYLVDVSTISESFKPEGTLIEMQIINRFRPRLQTGPIILGNLINYFLDEMVRNQDIAYPDLLSRVFRQQPLGLALLDNDGVRDLAVKLEEHYKRIRYVLKTVFPAMGISVADALLEPSFISERYGLQGRLDLLSQQHGRPVIVELKSGKPYRENQFGLSSSHYVQTLLYDLLIRSAHDNSVEPANFILYSSVLEKNLRHAPRSKKVQALALDLRNRYILLDRQIMKGGTLDPAWLTKLVDPMHPAVWGFTKKDLDEFNAHYGRLDELEKSYLLHFAGFLAREQHLSKTGAVPYRATKGFAALWLSELEDKMAQFDMLGFLKWEAIQADEELPIIEFSRTSQTNQLSNFRTGDIAILYGHAGRGAPLKQQLYRGTIIAMDHRSIRLRLRSKQVQQGDFEAFDYWHLERDMLDSGFLNGYGQLGQWMQLEGGKRALLLGQRPPERLSNNGLDGYRPEGLNPTQLEIFGKVVRSKDYFLLWGPPGTGKTSVMLREMSRYWLERTDDDLLLLAFTNRAVDEICESLESFGYRDYVRVGSRYSTGNPFRDRLLDGLISDIRRRDELLDFIRDTRIFVSTVSSIIGKGELLHIKNFQTLVVDEASQITEPMMAGLLGRFDRFILIGDHRQLPAVVQQGEADLEIRDDSLKSLGFKRLSDSLFERLFIRAKDQGWDWAYAQLCHQGRMHEDLMRFPNEHFYQGTLRLMEGVPSVLERQTAPAVPAGVGDAWGKARLYFFDIPVDASDPMGKTNDFEAQTIRGILKKLLEQYGELTGQEIGVITPYRSQIARITKEIRDMGLPVDRITVDTVERYQGGARDVIILSLCLNYPRQLKTLVNRSSEGVDRKLNVALTRAREKLFVLGNREIMVQDPTYDALAEYIEKYGLVV